MGATYLSMQLRTSDRERAVAALEEIARSDAGASLQFYVAEPAGSWLAVFPNLTPELERTAKRLSADLGCLIVLLLSADEDDLYCMFFRDGRQLPWLKVGAGRVRRGKEREKLAAKLEALAEVCDPESRARLVTVLADATGVTFSSELLAAVCETVGIRNAFTSFEYLRRGERQGLEPSAEPMFVPANVPIREG
jgi:hypothetical protein